MTSILKQIFVYSYWMHGNPQKCITQVTHHTQTLPKYIQWEGIQLNCYGNLSNKCRACETSCRDRNSFKISSKNKTVIFVISQLEKLILFLTYVVCIWFWFYPPKAQVKLLLDVVLSHIPGTLRHNRLNHNRRNNKLSNHHTLNCSIEVFCWTDKHNVVYYPNISLQLTHE